MATKNGDIELGRYVGADRLADVHGYRSIMLFGLNPDFSCSCEHRKELKNMPMSAMRDKEETAFAVLALLACVAHRLECSDFVN